MKTISLATPPPPRAQGFEGGFEQARDLRERLAGSRLGEALDTLFVPMIIDEDSFRPGEFVEHEDPLDYQAALSHELPRLETIVAQVTPFTATTELDQRVTRAREQSIERMVFVGVPREFDASEVVGLYPDQALNHFRDRLAGRGVITIPARDNERDRLGAKVRSGANFAITQLLYSDAIIDIARALVHEFEQPPELILSFGYVPAIEADNGLIRWLIEAPNAADEMQWVTDLANRTRDERREQLVELYRRITDRVREAGLRPGVNFEAPYGLSRGAIETFEAMLDVYDPRR
ncbi:MAG: mycobacterial-type methylenetetrahydrofolate reductase [Halofilum sp. (in: g-proteobacteria)]